MAPSVTAKIVIVLLLQQREQRDGSDPFVQVRMRPQFPSATLLPLLLLLLLPSTSSHLMDAPEIWQRCNPILQQILSSSSALPGAKGEGGVAKTLAS